MIAYLSEAYGHFAAALDGLWIWKTMLLMGLGVAGGLAGGSGRRPCRELFRIITNN